MGMGMGGCYIRSLRLCRGGVNCTQKSRQHGFFWLLVFFSGVLLWCSSGVVLPRRTQKNTRRGTSAMPITAIRQTKMNC